MIRTERNIKVRRKPYRKPEAVKVLEQMANDAAKMKHPTCPYLVKRVYDDRTANGLTKCVIDFLRFKGHQAERISCTGRYVDRGRVVTDCLGFKRRIGNGKWIPGSMQPGTADVSAIIRGRSVKIEIKIGKDRQSVKQREYQFQVEQSGGIYLIVNSFQDFWELYNNRLLRLI